MTDMERLFERYERFLWGAALVGIFAIGVLAYLMVR